MAMFINQKRIADSINIPAHSAVHQIISDPALLVPGSNLIRIQHAQTIKEKR